MAIWTADATHGDGWCGLGYSGCRQLFPDLGILEVGPRGLLLHEQSLVDTAFAEPLGPALRRTSKDPAVRALRDRPLNQVGVPHRSRLLAWLRISDSAVDEVLGQRRQENVRFPRLMFTKCHCIAVMTHSQWVWLIEARSVTWPHTSET